MGREYKQLNLLEQMCALMVAEKMGDKLYSKEASVEIPHPLEKKKTMTVSPEIVEVAAIIVEARQKFGYSTTEEPVSKTKKD